jgi:hypothetical protein
MISLVRSKHDFSFGKTSHLDGILTKRLAQFSDAIFWWRNLAITRTPQKKCRALQ